MPLNSPIPGTSPDEGFFSKSATFKNAPPRTPILSPIPGVATVSADRTIIITSPEGTKVEFKKVGTPEVTNGSKVNIGSSIGYTGTEPLEFTAFNSKGDKVKFSEFLKNTDPATLIAGAGAATGALVKTAKDAVTPDDEKKPKDKELDLGISTKDTHVDATERAGFRLATGIGLGPFHLTTKAFGLDEQKESQNRKENLINEEIERIKKLMK